MKKLMRIGIWLALIWMLSIPAAIGQDFDLEQVAEDFPSAGFEDEIEFWKLMFARYGETDIVFHDRRDLRLIYEVIQVERVIENDRLEAKRQRRFLDARKKELAKLFEDLRRGVEPGPEHQPLLDKLEALGYEPSPSLFRELRDRLRYQRGIREKFAAGIVRSGRYMDVMEDIFREEGLPVELAQMPHVESSFDYRARSRVGASGIWQFVRSTGRSYMTIGWLLDERLDPIHATRAAAKLLKDNYRALGNWPLALTAYNHGRNGMLRAKRKHGDDLRQIVKHYRSRLFGFASRNFYPEFLAALEVSGNYRRYFGELVLEPPIRFDLLHLSQGVHVDRFLESAKIEEAALRDLNPGLTNRAWEQRWLPGRTDLRLPPGRQPAALAAVRELENQPGAPPDGMMPYRVRRGDTLGGIASRFQVSISLLQEANGIRNRHTIHAGQVIGIPVVASSPKQPSRYRVRLGDTLHHIARRFNVSLSRLQSVNEIRNANRIRPGQVLLIPQ